MAEFKVIFFLCSFLSYFVFTESVYIFIKIIDFSKIKKQEF